GRVCRLALDACYRRFRSPDLRDPGISCQKNRGSPTRHERLYGLAEPVAVKLPRHSGLLLVAAREIRFFRRDRAGLFLLLAIPLIAFAVLTWTFSSAVVRGLNIVIDDEDRSSISSEFIDEIAAAPGLRVTLRADSLSTATQAIRSGEAIGAVY